MFVDSKWRRAAGKENKQDNEAKELEAEVIGIRTYGSNGLYVDGWGERNLSLYLEELGRLVSI